jgi:hypothetical protein
VLLCTQQRATHAARRLAQSHGRLAIWWATPIEARSAFARLTRDEVLQPRDVTAVGSRLASVCRAAIKVVPSDELRELAGWAVERFEVRAADAFQLAAALTLCHGRPRGRSFVCFDARLASAAALAGFTTLPA